MTETVTRYQLTVWADRQNYQPETPEEVWLCDTMEDVQRVVTYHAVQTRKIAELSLKTPGAVPKPPRYTVAEVQEVLP